MPGWQSSTQRRAGPLYPVLLMGTDNNGIQLTLNVAGLILIGASGYSAWSFNESMAHKVLTAVPCPVLTYHHEHYKLQMEALEAMHFNASGNRYEHYEAGRQTPRRMAHAS
jgi:hypothetical protein